ncbi:MAG: hypothetical protein QNK24_13025 [Desulfuromusa sp.]|nr:hypothetical protein [Desulfuromusa sp.]
MQKGMMAIDSFALYPLAYTIRGNVQSRCPEEETDQIAEKSVFPTTNQTRHDRAMLHHPFITFSKSNQRLILLLIASHMLWSCAILVLWSTGGWIKAASPWWSAGFIVLQLYAAAQLMLPALLLHTEKRSRSFYLFWGIALLLSIWLINQLPPVGGWQPLLTVIKSGLLLLIATLIGAALARYVHRLWEIIPICIAMTLADIASWLFGPTASFTQQIKQYYLAPEGPPPLIDMVLIKLVFPGSTGLAPVFGLSDWIMVVFFALVAGRFEVNDNLLGTAGETLARSGRIGCYLPVSVAALFAATLLAQLTGLFIPALPLIALLTLLWYAARYLRLRRRDREGGAGAKSQKQQTLPKRPL